MQNLHLFSSVCSYRVIGLTKDKLLVFVRLFIWSLEEKYKKKPFSATQVSYEWKKEKWTSRFWSSTVQTWRTVLIVSQELSSSIADAANSDWSRGKACGEQQLLLLHQSSRWPVSARKIQQQVLWLQLWTTGQSVRLWREDWKGNLRMSDTSKNALSCFLALRRWGTSLVIHELKQVNNLAEMALHELQPCLHVCSQHLEG